MSRRSNDFNAWSHPLIASYEPRRMDRRRLLLMTGAGLAAGVSLAPLHLVTAQGATPSAGTESLITGEEDARDILNEAVTAMADLETFAFEIETIAGETTLMTGITLDEIEGVVQRPSDFSASVNVSTPFGSISLSATGIGEEAWIQNPLGGGEWIALEGLGDISAILNPDTLLLEAVAMVKDARVDGSDRIDGTETTRIAGSISLGETASFLEDAPAEISDQPLDVLIWIGDDNYIREIELAGAILTTESESVIRLIRFFDFNEPVKIEQPDI